MAYTKDEAPAESQKSEAPAIDTAKSSPEKKVAEKKAQSFEFSDKDIQEFKEWKKQKEVKDSLRCDSSDDDKVYNMWKEESRMVKGVFRCLEPIGGNVKFSFRKYKWDQTKIYTMFDGETYEVPLAVARHLNQNCSFPVHSLVLGPDGNPTIDRLGKKQSRMNFESTTFAVV